LSASDREITGEMEPIVYEMIASQSHGGHPVSLWSEDRPKILQRPVLLLESE
jgi:hypothetical protein